MTSFVIIVNDWDVANANGKERMATLGASVKFLWTRCVGRDCTSCRMTSEKNLNYSLRAS